MGDGRQLVRDADGMATVVQAFVMAMVGKTYAFVSGVQVVPFWTCGLRSFTARMA